MPNWCSNSCRMTAPADHPLMVKIKAELDRGEGAQWFQAVVPVPQALLDQPARAGSPVTEDEEKLEATFGYRNWYDFCIAEWKTKWEAKVHSHDRVDGDSIVVWFDTAWSPPDGIYEAMHKHGIEVEAAYCEQGMGYMGWWKNGEECVVDMPVENDFNEDSMDFYHEIDKFFEDAGIAHAPEGLGG